MNEQNPERLTLTVAEVQKALGLSKSTVLNMIHEGRIRSVRAGSKRLLIPKSALAEFLGGTAKPAGVA
ncbi:MAG: helix-turn-helix domain-containing protein [Chloroflexi bacterium]|nr:helix-turn-helix domain-containing protein [Chloroflexota bacterium]